MKVGDLVRYRGWLASSTPPYGLVIDQASPDNQFHHRIRVMWIGEKIPIQAKVLSTKASRITTWVRPKSFEVVADRDETKFNKETQIESKQ